MAAAAAVTNTPEYGTCEYYSYKNCEPFAQLSRMQSVLKSIDFREDVAKEGSALLEDVESLYAPFKPDIFRVVALIPNGDNDKISPEEEARKDQLVREFNSKPDKVNHLKQRFFGLMNKIADHQQERTVYGARTDYNGQLNDLVYFIPNSPDCPQLNRLFPLHIKFRCQLFLNIKGNMIRLCGSSPLDPARVDYCIQGSEHHSKSSTNPQIINIANKLLAELDAGRSVMIDCRGYHIVDRMIVL